MDLLNQFYNDIHTREAVREFFLKQLDNIALKLVYNNKDTHSVALAKEVIEQSFTELKELYEKEKKASVLNKAR